MSKTTKIGLSFLGFIIILIFSSISSYNNILSKDESVKHATANLEATLQRRFDLIPNLVNTIKGYATHEQKTLQGVIEARSKATLVKLDLNNPTSVQNFQKTQNELSQMLSRLMVVVERYPDLKASANFQDLQTQLEGTENRINIARQNLNTEIQRFNISIRKFPNSIINNWFLHLTPKTPFQAEQAAQTAPKVNFE